MPLSATGRVFLVVLGLWWSLGAAAIAGQDFADFAGAEEQERYRVLIEELRCPQCQNQNLAASDAPVAADLRKEVLRLMRDGRSDTEIIDFLVERYGDFVRYRPRWQSATYLLWLGPGVLLVVAGLILALEVRQRRAHPAVEIDDAARETLTRLLNETGDNRVDDP
ncbi:MAG: cytochrome c-type biogenesis protein [Porticoccaceae bacterium]